METDQPREWSQFKLVIYAAPTGIPHGWDADLLEQGAPDGLGCTPLPALILLEDPEMGHWCALVWGIWCTSMSA
jgi:hypothetical protein